MKFYFCEIYYTSSFHKAMYQYSSFVAIQINMEFLFSHTKHLHFFTFIICIDEKQLKCGILLVKNKRITISNDTLMVLDNLKMLQYIFDSFHFLRCRMFPRMFQFLDCIRIVINRQA